MDAVSRVRSAGRWSRGGVVGHFEEVEDAARVPGKTAHGLGDSEPARLDDADGEASQPGHVLRAVAGADAAAVLVEAPVEDVVHRLDAPVSTIEGEEALGGCALGGEAGDAVDGFDAPLGGLDLDGVASNGEDLSDTGEVEVVVELGGDPDGAPFATAVLGLRPLVDELWRAPGDGLIESEPDTLPFRRRCAAPLIAPLSERLAVSRPGSVSLTAAYTGRAPCLRRASPRATAARSGGLVRFIRAPGLSGSTSV